jgi:hypothetical protein
VVHAQNFDGGDEKKKTHPTYCATFRAIAASISRNNSAAGIGLENR